MARQFDRAPNKRTSLGNEERKSYSSQYLKAGYSSNCPNVPRSLKQQRVSIWHQNLHSLIFTIPLIHHSSVCDAGDILPTNGQMQSMLGSSALSKLLPKPNANVPKFPRSNGINIWDKHNPTGCISRVSILHKAPTAQWQIHCIFCDWLRYTWNCCPG